MSARRGKPFEVGNKLGQGRPPGSRNKKSLALQELLLDHGEEIVLKAVRLAKQGDPVALRLCIERLIPSLKPIEMCVDSKEPQRTSVTVRFVDDKTGVEEKIAGFNSDAA